MSDKATVLCVKKTGHVLGAVTRTGDPERALTVEELADPAFPVRAAPNGDVLVEVPGDELVAKNVDLRSDLLTNPQECRVLEDDSVQLDVVALTGPQVTFDDSGVSIALTNAVAAKTPVWAQVEFGTGSARERVVLTGEIPPNGKNAELAHGFGNGDHDLLLLVPGFKPWVEQKLL